MISWNSKYVLAVGFGMVLLLMLALGFMGLQSMSTIQHNMQRIVEEENAKTELVATMRHIARERSLTLFTLLYTEDPFKRDELIGHFRSLANEFVATRDKFLAMRLSREEHAAFKEVLLVVTRASNAQNQVVDEVENNHLANAIRLLSEETLPAQQALFTHYNHLVRLHQEHTRQALQSSKQTYHRSVFYTIVLGGAIVVWGIMIALWTIRLILRTENALFEEKELAEVTLHSIADGVITTDMSGCVSYMNPMAELLTGWTSRQARGRQLGDVYQIVDENTRQPLHTMPHDGRVDIQIEGGVNHLLINRHGREFAVEDSVAPIRNRAGQVIGGVLICSDVTESRKLEQQLSWQASHDALTGLTNRHEFERRLAGLLEEARFFEKQHVLLYLDLDQFKVVNDTCGHMAGDELLRHLTLLLADQVRDHDTLARLGGDEFGVLLAYCPLEQGLRIAEGIRKAIAGYKFSWEGKLFDVGVSIGLVPINVRSESIAALLSAADAACYAAKEEGRNRIHVYQGDATSHRRHGEMLWVPRINQALEQNSFVLLGQQVCEVSAKSHMRHFEILLRIRGQHGELLAPMSFIPAAERYNLMPAIDKWVIGHTLAWLAARGWGEEKAMQCSINLSGQSLGEESFLNFVLEQFDTYGVVAGRICFELTETAAIANLNRARRFIAILREKGCSFALDDFGSGMSSYAYLKNLAVDSIKIDGVFVKDMVNDAVDAAMVESINRIGHVMGLQTIAECVENEAVLERLRLMGVDYAQGFYLHQPEPLENLS